MNDVETIDEVEESIDDGSTTLLLFTRETTPERERLIRGVRRLVRQNTAVRAFHIDLDTIPTAAARYTIYSTPAYAVYYRGRMASKVEGDFRISHIAQTLVGLLG